MEQYRHVQETEKHQGCGVDDHQGYEQRTVSADRLNQDHHQEFVDYQDNRELLVRLAFPVVLFGHLVSLEPCPVFLVRHDLRPMSQAYVVVGWTIFVRSTGHAVLLPFYSSCYFVGVFAVLLIFAPHEF